MKVCVNRCFGGFGLSSIAIQKYLEKKGKTAYFYIQTKYKFIDGEDEFTKINNLETQCRVVHTLLKDYGDIISLKDPSYRKGEYFSTYDIDRDDPDLISVVEELGSEKASGDFAELEIVEIPDDVNYEIDDYDGMESIHEKHRSW